MGNLTFNAIDVETANRTRASICQIGIAQVKEGRISQAASFLVNPEEPFESFQTSIHGINEETVNEAETMLSIPPPALQDDRGSTPGESLAVRQAGPRKGSEQIWAQDAGDQMVRTPAAWPAPPGPIDTIKATGH